jgi:hypothetical protein
VCMQDHLSPRLSFFKKSWITSIELIRESSRLSPWRIRFLSFA